MSYTISKILQHVRLCSLVVYNDGTETDVQVGNIAVADSSYRHLVTDFEQLLCIWVKIGNWQ